MASVSWWYVEVIVRVGGSKTQAIQGPTRNSEDEAKSDLRMVQEKLGSGDWINLDWISANPEYVVAAYVTGGGIAIA